MCNCVGGLPKQLPLKAGIDPIRCHPEPPKKSFPILIAQKKLRRNADTSQLNCALQYSIPIFRLYMEMLFQQPLRQQLQTAREQREKKKVAFRILRV